MVIHIVACVADNNVIGLKGGMPWPKLHTDLDRFRQLTWWSPVIMGDATYKSIGQPLRDRLNVIITYRYGSSFTSHDNVLTAPSLVKAFKHLGAEKWQHVYVIGGQSIYEQALPYANFLHITELYEEYEGDRFFPEFDATEWTCVYREDMLQHDAANKTRDMAFTRYMRRNF